MKKVKYILLSFFLLSLLVINVAAHGDDNTNEGANNHMGSGHHMPGTHMHHNGFDAQSTYMNITGEVFVEDAIIISLSVTPTREMYEHMKNQDMPMDHQHIMPEEFSNSINVSIPKVIEFLDFDENGYSPNDSVLSTYFLNSDTLNDPVISENDGITTFNITSIDESFNMYIDLQEDQGLAHIWKWSVELNYEFADPNARIAVIQEIISNGEHIHHHQLTQQEREGFGQISEMRIKDNHPQMPMFFKWDRSATVDGAELPVTVTRIAESIAITIPSGNSIFYDPSIGIDISTITAADDILAQFDVNSFFESVKSPSTIGLLLGGLLVVSVIAIYQVRIHIR